nr:DUF6421 family protein [Nakamurella flava]
MSVFPRVAIVHPDPSALSDGYPVDDVEQVVTRRGWQLTDVPDGADVVVTIGPAVIVEADRAGSADTEPGPAVDALDDGGPVVQAVVHDDGPGRAIDLLAHVRVAELRASGTLAEPADGWVVLRSSGRPVVVAASPDGGSRRVVLAIEPDAGPAYAELLGNAIAFAADAPSDAPVEPDPARTGHPAWLRLKAAVGAVAQTQSADGSIPDPADHLVARDHVATIVDAVEDMAPSFRHDQDYLSALVKDLRRWSDGGFGVPDFLDSLTAFHPERARVDGREHLVVFPMYTQNGSPDRHLEAVLLQVIWPDFVADLQAGAYSNKLFVPVRFLDFTAGYDTNSAVLFPETVAMREVPKFTWGAIFADREAARFRRVITAAADITGLALPPEAARLLGDQRLTEETFVMWDLIHDRTHMHGDLPFDPFMIKQRMPFFLYTLEELRCDLTAFAESVSLEQQGHPHARLVQYAVVFDRIFRFAITGSRVRNYDGLGGQLLFGWLHQHHVLHWTDNRLSIEWDRVADAVLELKRQIDDLYWRSIDRPKIGHWLAAYDLISATVAPHPASVWAKGPDALPLDGPPKGLTDVVRADEFPLSMFYEALSRKLSPVIASTSGITG